MGVARSTAAGVTLMLAVGLAVGGCGSSSPAAPACTAKSAAGSESAAGGPPPPAAAGNAVGPANPAVAPSWSLPGGNLANTRDVASAITSSNVSRLGVAWTVPLRHIDHAYRRRLRDHAGAGERRGVRPGPGVERDGDQPRHRQGPLAAHLQLAQRRPGRRQRGPRRGVRGDQSRRGRPVGGHRQAALEPDPDRQQPRGHRHGPRLQPRHRLRVHRAGQPDRGRVPRRRQGDLVGAERRDRRAGVELGRGAEPVGEPARQLRRRPVVPAVV